MCFAYSVKQPQLCPPTFQSRTSAQAASPVSKSTRNSWSTLCHKNGCTDVEGCSPLPWLGKKRASPSASSDSDSDVGVPGSGISMSGSGSMPTTSWMPRSCAACVPAAMPPMCGTRRAVANVAVVAESRDPSEDSRVGDACPCTMACNVHDLSCSSSQQQLAQLNLLTSWVMFHARKRWRASMERWQTHR